MSKQRLAGWASVGNVRGKENILYDVLLDWLQMDLSGLDRPRLFKMLCHAISHFSSVDVAVLVGLALRPRQLVIPSFVLYIMHHRKSVAVTSRTWESMRNFP